MLWNITPNVTIPSGGVLTATATCQTIGPVLANAGDINIIYNIMSGWNSVLNPASAVPGMAQETDLTLRKEQSTSVMLSSTTPVAGTLAALSQLSGVKRVFIDENTGALADADGVPPHSIGVIIDGGDSIEIAEAIAQHKTIGCGTSGSINIPLPAAYGIEGNINFSRAIYDTIGVEITLTMFAGYTQAIQDQIIANVTNFLNTLPIGVTVTASALYLPTLLAQLSGIPSFNVSSLVINENGGEFGASAVVGWNEAAVAGTIVIAGGL
jgi:uncharacterized phage protein gp47/JayE